MDSHRFSPQKYTFIPKFGTSKVIFFSQKRVFLSFHHQKEDFNKPKIVWARLMRITQSDIDAFPRFCFAPEEYLVVDSLCFFTGKDIDKLVLALNSEYATWYFFNNVATLDNGGFQMRQQYVEEIPLPDVARLSYTNVDEQLYRLFSFNEDEIKYVRSVIRERKEEILLGGSR